jgi:hypothetical protein
MSLHSNVKRVTTHVLLAMKLKGEKIAMLTAMTIPLPACWIRPGSM